MDRFWSKVKKTDSCWLWRAGANQHGYGNYWDNSKTYKAHRFAWQLFHGDIPEGKQCLHKCNNPRCVNPEHLYLGTQIDNIAQMVASGRQAKGSSHAHSVLTENIVKKIKRRNSQGTTSQRDLAHIFDVSQSSISLILSGKTWRHVS